MKTEVEGESELTWKITVGSAFRLSNRIAAGRAVLELYRKGGARVKPTA